MSKLRAGLMGAMTLGLGLFAANTAMATPTFSVGGITLPVGGGNLISTDIWEDVVSGAGQTLTGVGKILEIDDRNGTAVWNPSAGMELTFRFDYKVEKIFAADPTHGVAYFSGGTVNFYTDTTPDFNVSGTRTNAINMATNGNLWLSLIGAGTGQVCGDATIGACFSANGTPITLASTFDISGSDLTKVGQGSGAGFLDVALVGGPAGPDFNTNSFPGGQDILLNSDFSSNAPAPAFALKGTADLQACIQDVTDTTHIVIPCKVPEPGTLWLLGAGLLGLAGMRRRVRARS